MTIEEYVRESREEIRQQFGEVGVKEDCVNYVPGNRCMACGNHDTGRRSFMQCELGICYFYKREGKR